jgi:hydrogenase maturation protease
MNANNRILVAGIGNIFFGDDAFGVEVIRELAKSPLPEGVNAVDFGIRSYDLAYAIMNGYAATILVDITSRGEPPGTLYLIELDQEKISQLEATVPDGHSLDPVAVLRLVQSLGGQDFGELSRVAGALYLVACEPAILETEDGKIGLSEPVQAAVPEAIQMIRRLIGRLRGEETSASNFT